MIKTTTKIILSLCMLSLPALNSFAQLVTNTTPTPTFLVTNVLLGTGVSATGITYNGSPQARGSFTYSGPTVGFTSGVLLSSGNIATAIGPNGSGSAGTDLPDGIDGDPDLNSISGFGAFDGAILEFDFVPLSDTIKFRYVFASEEYMEFAGSTVNDAFGFFISGPGISGPFAGGAKNIAIIPGTSTPVTINTLNATTTPSLYVDNESPPGATVQYDGLTVPLTAITAVQCGETYHIKLAISDAGDGIYDSGVFLEAGSFSSVGVSIIPEISYGGADDSTLYEGCGNACIYFVRTSGLSTTDTINVTIGGTTVNGVDYYDNSVGPGAPLPSQLVFLPGQDSISFCINAVSDTLLEGMESITLSIQPVGSALCVPPPTEATIYLNEYSPMSVTVSDTIICAPGGLVNINTTVTGGVEPYTFVWTGGAAAVEDPTVNVSTTTSYIVTVNDACTGTVDPTPAVTDTATITVAPSPTVSVQADISYVGAGNDSTLYEGCGYACIYFIRTSGLSSIDTINVITTGTAVNGTDYYDNSGGPGTLVPNQLIFAVGQDSISFCISTVNDGATEGIETITFSTQPIGLVFCLPSFPVVANLYLNELSLMAVTVSDTTLCNLGGTVTINSTVTGGVEPYTYTWTSGAAPVADPTVTVTTTTNFILTVTDACIGSPVDPTPSVTDTSTIIVATFAPMVVSAGTDQTICLGEVITFEGGVTGGGAPYVYSWTTVIGTDTVNTPFTPTTTLNPSNSGVFQLSVIDVCANTQFDQVSVTVEPNCDLIIPNVITPDGTGPLVNETFYIDNLDKFPNSALIIYNRWGKKVYETDNYDNQWNGSKYSDGTYYFILTVPPSGSTMAELRKESKYASDIKTSTEGSNSVFAGFFQIVRAK